MRGFSNYFLSVLALARDTHQHEADDNTSWVWRQSRKKTGPANLNHFSSTYHAWTAEVATSTMQQLWKSIWGHWKQRNTEIHATVGCTLIMSSQLERDIWAMHTVVNGGLNKRTMTRTQHFSKSIDCGISKQTVGHKNHHKPTVSQRAPRATTGWQSRCYSG